MTGGAMGGSEVLVLPRKLKRHPYHRCTHLANPFVPFLPQRLSACCMFVMTFVVTFLRSPSCSG
jgi:hypothetical protein